MFGGKLSPKRCLDKTLIVGLRVGLFVMGLTGFSHSVILPVVCLRELAAAIMNTPTTCV